MSIPCLVGEHMYKAGSTQTLHACMPDLAKYPYLYLYLRT